MIPLYDWSRWFGNARPPAATATSNELIPDRSRHPAEITGVRFVKVEHGLDRVFTFRITSGKFNNVEVNYRVKAIKPARIKPLLDVIMPDRTERADLMVNRDARLWAKALTGRAATIVVGVFKEFNYVAEILP